MLYIHTAMKAAITRLRFAAICPAQDQPAKTSSIQGGLILKYWPGNNAAHCPIRVARRYPEDEHGFHPQLALPLFGAQVFRITKSLRSIRSFENLNG